jgi:hypothetical protein
MKVHVRVLQFIDQRTQALCFVIKVDDIFTLDVTLDRVALIFHDRIERSELAQDKVL